VVATHCSVHNARRACSARRYIVLQRSLYCSSLHFNTVRNIDNDDLYSPREESAAKLPPGSPNHIRSPHTRRTDSMSDNKPRGLDCVTVS